MPTLNRSELARFLSEDLTAAAVMVPINDPIDPAQAVQDAHHYLKENKFDLALVSGDRLLVLSRAAADRQAATDLEEAARTVGLLFLHHVVMAGDDWMSVTIDQQTPR